MLFKGFFGVCPGTSDSTNPIAMKTIQKDTIFTNVARTTDGKVYWEGLDEEIIKKNQLISWKGMNWTKTSNEPAAHPNSRFCAPIENCPIRDSEWNNPEGLEFRIILK